MPLIGDIEIEERRPKSWNEPRRKRLRFVRSKSKVRSKDKQLDRYDPNWQPAQRQPAIAGAKQNQADLWDSRKLETQRRFHVADQWQDWRLREQQARQVHMIQQQQWQQHQQRLQQQGHHPQHQIGNAHHGQQGHHPQQGHHGQGQHGQHVQHGQHGQRPRPQQHHLGEQHAHWGESGSDSDGSELVDTWSESSDSDSDDDWAPRHRAHSRRRSSSHHRHHRSSSRKPRLIMAKPKNAGLGRVFYPKHSARRRDSRGRRVYYDDDSSDSDDSFDRAVPVHRGRSRSRGRAKFIEYSSDDDSFIRRHSRPRSPWRKGHGKFH